MDTERIPTLSDQNPRNSNHFSLSKSLSNDVLPPPKPSSPPPTVMDKFKDRLKQRDDEFRVSSIDDDDVPPPSTDDIVTIYESVLSELTFNSKPIITDLTIIAGEQRAHAAGIADAICSRIIEVPVEQKLPSLYLLDSIVKNIGRDYVRHFASRLPEVFCEAYRQVDPSLYSAMRHLFGTWKSVFPPSVLHKIDVELQFTSPASNQSPGFDGLRTSESPQPSHGIHVNPKYVRQLDHPGADSDGAAPSRLKSTEIIVRSSYPLGTNKLHASSYTGTVKPLSPHVNAPDRPLTLEVDEFPTGNSPRRLKRASPGPMFDYSLGRSIGREEHIGQWRRNQFLDDGRRLGAAASFNPTIGRDYPDPRALIDAYGSDDRDTPINKPVQIGPLNFRGKMATRSWQDTEEQEFDWEDMSPTLADHSGRSNGFLPSSVQPFGGSRARQGLRKLDRAPPVDTANSLSSQLHLPPVDDTSIYAADAIPSLGSGRGSIDKLPGFQNDTNQIIRPRNHQGAWNMSCNIPTSQHFRSMGRGRVPGVQHTVGTVATVGEQRPYEKLQNVEQTDRLPIIASRTSSSPLESISAEANDANLPTSAGTWQPTNLRRQNLPPVQPMLPLQGQIRSPFGPSAASNIVNQVSITTNIMNQAPKQSSLVAEQQFDKFEGRESTARPPLPNQQAPFIPQNQQFQAVSVPFRPQFPQPQEGRDKFPSSSVAMLPAQNMGPTPNFSFNLRGQGPAITAVLANPLIPQPPLLLHNIPNTSLYMQGGSLPPLPPGPPPASTQILAVSESLGAVVPDSIGGSAYSGLFSSLMAQGLISLTNPTNVQDYIGLDFNVDLLKVRHESAIRALYADLPRQCTTCGLRFKCQEEHSSHMDWHVTKNRMSKSRKQKPPRKWFVSVSMWLSGAEALGAEAVPGFLPSETAEEKKADEEMAVPADEDQTVCALCGEPFDDFYSDETEEWMYRGAVYMNAPDGLAAGMDRSQLGPIVHAKCRSESTTESPGNFGPDEGGSTEEGSQRKKLRS